MYLSGLLLTLSIVTLSQAGNIIRLCDAPPPVVAFYRLIMAFILLAPIGWYKFKKHSLKLSKHDFLQTSAMGIFFAFHFFTWISAIQHTTVANAAILFSSAPLMTAIGANFFFKESVHRGIAVAMISGIIGVIFTGVGDLSFESRYLYGDLMGVLAAVFFACYFLMGKKVQAKSNFFITMPLVFLAAAVTSLLVIFWQGLPLTGFSPITWSGFVALAILPTIIGHGLLIYSLRIFSSSTVSTLTLVEPILAALGAWVYFGEAPLWYSGIGYLVMAVGLGYMFNYSRQR